MPVSGAKNSALKLMAATLLAPGKTTLQNVPDISDVHVMGKVLKGMGATIDVLDEHTLEIDTSQVDSWEAPYELVAKMRASTAVMGPLLGRFHRAKIAMPGGCNLGARKIDMHILGLEALGVEFDTAHGYLQGKSERALKTCLTSRYPREKYILTNKLSGGFFKTEADIRPLFESQLEACGVDYFDFYLMHSQGEGCYPHYKKCRAYETAFELKKEGKVRHVGISFHDRAEFLEQILTEYPEIEAVQIQFNYVDYDDLAVQSRRCYEVCRKYNKPVLVMEPVKGGNLVNLPEEAKAILENLHGGSPASYAIRFAAGFPGMMMVLSGMSSLRQMQDNISFMRDFKPLNEQEMEAIRQVQEIFKSRNLIPCTACRYCTDGCPQHIAIPDIFAARNAKEIHRDWNADYYYSEVCTAPGRRASDCLQCGKCEKVCPQHLPIRELLQEVAGVFEKPQA